MEISRNPEKFSADFVMGVMAAVVSKTTAAPIERVKFLLRNQEMIKRVQLKTPYMGDFYFALKGYFKSVFGCSKEKDGHLKCFAGNAASDSAAGAATSLLIGTNASDCKHNSQRQFKGLLDVYGKNCFGVSIIGITLYRNMYFGIYDTMKPVILAVPLEGFVCRRVISLLVFCWVSVCWIITTVSGVCAYPFDTLKWRMMLISEQPLRYQNAMHAFHEISRLEGYRPLFRVVTAKMLLGVAGAGVLAGYDRLHRISLRRGYVFDQ
ncbi:hypothetical protein K2173_028328 [Erythroxylum novogranatense]|uniref:ADP/ATP translocase n=1 Tax=Erythroxylum novogranatense TaxID=1862640 RepID=A0AAV8U1J6_9ROSI|nr:hypothetical protein K2173_028328 [Erythroxylum novogranatense]